MLTVSDVSPIIIDEDNGIVYSPGLKRSDYMAARLRDMKENRENLPSTGMSCCANKFIFLKIQAAKFVFILHPIALFQLHKYLNPAPLLAQNPPLEAHQQS